MGMRHFSTETLDGFLVLQLINPKLYDTLVISELEDELLELLDREQPDRVIVDFTAVTHCSTAVINGLLRAKKRLLSHGGRLRLCGMRPAIRDAYRILNLDGTVFHIDENLDESKTAFLAVA